MTFTTLDFKRIVIGSITGVIGMIFSVLLGHNPGESTTIGLIVLFGFSLLLKQYDFFNDERINQEKEGNLKQNNG